MATGEIQQRVANRLRSGGLLQDAGDAVRRERGERVVRRAFLLGLRRQLVLETDRRREHVDVDAEQPFGCLAAHRVGDEGAHVAALGDVAGVAEAVHQLRPGDSDVALVPAELPRLSR
jgi:hypothetical protein